MTEESSASSHLSVAMTTTGMTQIATSSGSRGMDFYFQCAVIFIGVIGTAANGLILYALVSSDQHKKHVLIVNQNLFDFFSSFFLIVIFSLKLCNIYLTGATGYWLCITILSECLWTWTAGGSITNLAIITVEPYLKVVHPVWSKKKLRKWMIYSAMAFAWISSFGYNLAMLFPTTFVLDGKCYPYVMWGSTAAHLVNFFYSFISYYVIILLIFTFCYWRILVVIRRQARVMAAHSGRSSTETQAQTQFNHMQSNVIKTMLFVSAFYAISWFPLQIVGFLTVISPNLTNLINGYYASLFITFLYVCANPFVYATKFEPVKKVLLRMIPWKNTSQQVGESIDTGTGSTLPPVPRSTIPGTHQSLSPSGCGSLR